MAPPARSGTRRRTLAAVIALAVVGAGAASLFVARAYWTALHAPAMGMFHDDGIYAVTAKALATGRGYRIVSLPTEIAQTKYPILFPALLAVVWKLFPHFPENLFWLKLVPFLCTLVWGALGYQLFREKTGSVWAAMALTGWMAAAPWVLFLGTALLSETLFAALMTGALVLLGRLERGRGGWATAVGVAVLASAAFLTRTAGITLIVVGVLILCMRGRWKQVAAFALICAALCGPWIWWQAEQQSAALDHEPYYSRANYRSWNILLRFTLAEKAQILSQNLLGALLAPAALVGVPATGGGPILALALGALIVAGFAASLAWRPAALEIFVLLYGAVVLSWAWPPVRFLAPLLPVLLLYAYRGAKAVCVLLGMHARATHIAMASLAVLFLLQGGWSLAQTALTAGQTGAVRMPGVPQDEWRETVRMFDWIERYSSPDAVLIGNLDPALYLYTGRKSVRGFVQNPYLLHYTADERALPLGGAGELLDTIRWYGASYLVAAPNASFKEGPYLARLTRDLLREHPHQFRLTYRSADSQYKIYAIALEGCTSDLSVKANCRSASRLVGSD